MYLMILRDIDNLPMQATKPVVRFSVPFLIQALIRREDRREARLAHNARGLIGTSAQVLMRNASLAQRQGVAKRGRGVVIRLQRDPCLRRQ